MSDNSIDFGGSMSKTEKYKRQIVSYVESNGGECITAEAVKHCGAHESLGYRLVNEMEEDGIVDRGNSIVKPSATTIIYPND
jgi:transposase